MVSFEGLKPTKQIVLIEDKNIVFFLSAKCGSTSFRKMLTEDMKYRDIIYIKKESDLLMHKNKRWFLLIRNPFDRIVSLWLDKVNRRLLKGFEKLGIRRDTSFKVFCKIIKEIDDWSKVDSHLWPQTILCKKYMEKIIPIDLYKLNNWPDELNVIGHKNKDKSYTNKGKIWDPSSKFFIENLYNADFKLLGYNGSIPLIK